jgi:tRNA uridine 5-carbamoylmethylation protein Kti12
MDPRAKIRGFSSALQVLSRFVITDYSEHFNTIRNELTNIFSKYEIKYGATRLHRSSQSTSTTRRKKT